VLPAKGNGKVAKRAPATPVTFTVCHSDGEELEEIELSIILNNILERLFPLLSYYD
jgi:hypothetical protein